jgi:predicted DNA-binding antitoxin AbrB/MazE fold protein
MTKTLTAIYERGVLRLMQPMEIPEGTTIEIIVVSKSAYSQQESPAGTLAKTATLITNYPSRQEFMQMPLEERRNILAEQAEIMLPHYQENGEWQELETGDLIDY